ncbi:MULTISPECIES: penicillin-binding transpeptidase domain-containing protein [unclassified Nocardioides]|uniref:penicillin-binding transpeptidase domain-containing protein n=1 Tax=unclassified Nocardioides TaxID=2615069 RepID=UPI0006F65700|nr:MULTISPECIES: penicillin-binding transpeptidase domain-containing protein [unclassified Nocardioides]KRA39018.1 penicillin-binding protein [Nocardioides sp. Root614]KRA92977.1 penicillin-binding protein [Nocardioides sp. Root682]
MRRTSVTLVPLLLVLLPVAGGLAACSNQGDDEKAAHALAVQLAGVLATAAAPEGEDAGNPQPDRFATVPFGEVETATVAEAYASIIDDMDGIAPSVSASDEATVTDDKATATLTWSWPESKDAAWGYDTQVDLVRSGEEWSVVWTPSIVEPSLKDGDVLDAVTQPTDRGDVLGAGDEVLVTERPVIRVGIDRTRVEKAQAPASAKALAELVDIDVAPFVKAVTNAGDRAFVEAITYREGEVPGAVQTGVRTIDGAHQVSAEVALAPTRDFAAPILGRVGPVTGEMVEKSPDKYRTGDIAGLSGLQGRYDDQLRGTPGRIVYAVPEAGDAKKRTLYDRAPVAGRNLSLTLDTATQNIAESVLAKADGVRALVAIRPSDGAILAAASPEQNYATFGQFAPGSTFKIVTSLALLRAGLTPDTPVECTPTTTVNGKRFKNYSDYPSAALGTIPLRRAIANSCNTALINARAKVDDGDLAAAAASLGLGIDHDLGFPAFFGEVPDPASETEAAADLIGQGKVLASPMAMAAVIASVQAGKTVVPRLLEQVDVTVPKQAAPLTADEAAALKTMLRGVVTDGSGRGLADVPGGPVIAKTGTAEYADGAAIRTHAWMVSAQGDLAVAVFVQTGVSGSQTAGPLIEEFLRRAR